MALFELSIHLRTPVHVLRTEMPYEDYQKYFQYLERRPIGWQDDLRAYRIMQAFGTQAKPHELFESLAAVMGRREVEHVDGMLQQPKLGNSSMLSRLLSAKGGEALKYDESETDGVA